MWSDEARYGIAGGLVRRALSQIERIGPWALVLAVVIGAGLIGMPIVAWHDSRPAARIRDERDALAIGRPLP